MKQQGWIKLHRKILDNPIITKPLYAWLWTLLLLKASHAEQKIMWNGKFIIIKEGQLLTGRDQLVKESKLPATTIERILKYLENGHQIGQQKTTKYRIITILNWEEYQKRTSKRTTNGHQTDTYKNVYKNEKKIIASQASATDSLFKRALAYYFKRVEEEMAFKPEFSGQDGATLKRELKKRPPQEIKDLIEFYLKSKKAKDVGVSMSAIFSTHSVNLFKKETAKDNWQTKK